MKSIECPEDRSVKCAVLISDSKARSYEDMQEVGKGQDWYVGAYEAF